MPRQLQLFVVPADRGEPGRVEPVTALMLRKLQPRSLGRICHGSWGWAGDLVVHCGSFLSNSFLLISLNCSFELYTRSNPDPWQSCLALFLTYLQSAALSSPFLKSVDSEPFSALSSWLASSLSFCYSLLFPHSFIPQTLTECRLPAGNLLRDARLTVRDLVGPSGPLFPDPSSWARQ